MLDETMAYSCAIFPRPDATLAEGSDRQVRRRLPQARSWTPNDHVLEIGTGWGGFAIHAVQRYGCRVTTTTISRAQHDYAQRKIDALGLDDRITVLLQDYRDLSGPATTSWCRSRWWKPSARNFLDGYFRQCSRC